MNIYCKKVLVLMITLALLVTSIDLTYIKVDADNEIETTAESGEIKTDNTINDKNDTVLRNALSNTTYNIDGMDYNNYIKYNGVSAYASTEKDSVEKLKDGNLQTRWESNWGSGVSALQSVTVDFGNKYNLKDIIIYWEAASAKTYDLEISEDGISFTKLTDVESTLGERIDNIKLEEEISVRAIRISGITKTTNYGYSIYEIGVYGSSPQGEYVPVLSNLQVRDYAKYTGKYLVYFNEEENSKNYNIYIDNDEIPIKTSKTNGVIITSKDLSEYSVGTHTLSVSNVSLTGKESAKISTTFTKLEETGNNTDIPQIYINTSKQITNEYMETSNVSVSVIDKDGGTNSDVSDNASNIKIRGNTTAGNPKKPWNIKFSGKKSVLGMEKGKKWCLLANAFDKSLMRNKLAYDFGLESGVTYTNESRYVDVYLNGVFQGNYLITEPVEAKTGRVEIDAYNAENNDILLELGTRNELGVDHFTTDILRTTYDVNDPEKGDDLTDNEVDSKIARVKTYLNGFETTLKTHNYDEILQYIDESTFVNFYITSELFKNVDFNFSSTRFYIKNNKIYAGPLWDFDLSSGNCKSSYYKDYYIDGDSSKGFYCQTQNWYRELLKTEEFYNKVKSRYKDLQYQIQNLYKENSVASNSIDFIKNSYGSSFQRNYFSKDTLGAGWSLTDDDGYSFAAESGWATWEEPITFLRTWLKNRNEWICAQWGIDVNGSYETTTSQVPTTPETTTPETTKNTLDVSGYQISTSLNSVEGSIGFRVIYQSEPQIMGQKVMETGLIYGLTTDENTIEESDMVLNSNNEFVKDFKATEEGLLSQMPVNGTSQSANYYVRTMESNFDNPQGYNATYSVRAYALLEDGSISYSDVYNYTIFNIASYLYDNNIMSTEQRHNILYNKILNKVDSTYPITEFDYKNTLLPS